MTPASLHTSVAGFAEVGLRVDDLEEMAAFYQKAFGLVRWREYPGYVFLAVSRWSPEDEAAARLGVAEDEGGEAPSRRPADVEAGEPGADDGEGFQIDPGSTPPPVLALIDRARRPWGWANARQTPGPAGLSTLDHVTFRIPLEAYEDERAWLEELDLEVVTGEFRWMRTRALFVRDPEGNPVQLVAHDPSLVPWEETETGERPSEAGDGTPPGGSAPDGAPADRA